jgi:hypothetical protein
VAGSPAAVFVIGFSWKPDSVDGVWFVQGSLSIDPALSVVDASVPSLPTFVGCSSVLSAWEKTSQLPAMFSTGLLSAPSPSFSQPVPGLVHEPVYQICAGKNWPVHATPPAANAGPGHSSRRRLPAAMAARARRFAVLFAS